MSVDPEKLMAFADGELTGRKRAEVEATVAENAELREKLAAHRRLRARLSAAFEVVLHEPVPARLLAAAETPGTANVVNLSERRGAPWSMRELGAMAAGVVLGLFVGVSTMSAQAPPIGPSANGLVARGALAQALERQLASDEPGAVRIGLSFRAEDGRYCRTFELTRGGTAGLACREGEAWDVAMTAGVASGGEVRTAGASDEILAKVDAMIAGEPLDADAEARVRDAGWR